jgi:cold shock CspA family protein
MATGTIKKYFDERGFGFIKPADGGPDVFFHVRNFVNLPEDVALNERDCVSFGRRRPRERQNAGAEPAIDLKPFSFLWPRLRNFEVSCGADGGVINCSQA